MSEALFGRRQGVHFVLIENASNGADDGRRARSEDLEETILGLGGEQLLHGDVALVYLKLAPFGGELDDATTRHSWENDALVQARRHELLLAVGIFHEDENVHGANFGNLVILAEEPQHLLTAIFFRLFADPQRGRVVAAHLSKAATARPRPHKLRVGQEVDGLDSGGEIGSNRAQQHEEQSLVGGSDSQSGFSANQRGPNIKGGAGAMRDPLLFELDESPHALEQLVAIEGREAGPLGGHVHPGHIVHRPKHANAIVDAAVRLHALEELLSVVEHLGAEVHGNRSVRHDLGRSPTVLRVPSHSEHMIRKRLTEEEFVDRRFPLQLGRHCRLDLQPRAEK